MLLLHVLLAPLIGLPLLALLRKKRYRDAAVFGAVSAAGYGLWFGAAVHRPIIITIMIGKIFESLNPF
jgi:hypothetical protein